MEDLEIVRLYWARDQQALQETGEKYGAYLRKIALNILADPEDAEECVNDTYAGAWNAIPPHSPQALSTFLGKLTRRIALNRLRELRSYKRGGGEATAVLDELSECVASDVSTKDAVEAAELGRLLDAFLDTLPRQRRAVFVRRYWHMESIADIAAAAGMSEGSVKTSLCRTREKLKSYLKRRTGYEYGQAAGRLWRDQRNTHCGGGGPDARTENAPVACDRRRGRCGRGAGHHRRRVGGLPSFGLCHEAPGGLSGG